MMAVLLVMPLGAPFASVLATTTTPQPATVAQPLSLDAGDCDESGDPNSVVGSVVPFNNFDNGTYIKGAAGYIRYSQHLHACSGFVGYYENGESDIWAANIGGPYAGYGVQLGLGTSGGCSIDCFMYTANDTGLGGGPVPQSYCNHLPIEGHRYEFLINVAILNGATDWEYRIIDRSVSPQWTCNWYRGASWTTGTSAQWLFETIHLPSVMDATGSPFDYIYSTFIENSTSGWIRQCDITAGWLQGPDIPYVDLYYTTSSCDRDTFYVWQH